jgi:hypothetical protein
MRPHVSGGLAAIEKELPMTSTIKIALLAAVGTALLAGSASAQTYQHRARHAAVHSRVYAPAYIPGGQIYLLENRGPGTRNTNAAEHFQDQFNIDY